MTNVSFLCHKNALMLEKRIHVTLFLGAKQILPRALLCLISNLFTVLGESQQINQQNKHKLHIIL